MTPTAPKCSHDPDQCARCKFFPDCRGPNAVDEEVYWAQARAIDTNVSAVRTLSEPEAWREVARMYANRSAPKGMHGALARVDRVHGMQSRTYLRAANRLSDHVGARIRSVGFAFVNTRADRVLAALWLALEAESEA